MKKLSIQFGVFAMALLWVRAALATPYNATRDTGTFIPEEAKKVSVEEKLGAAVPLDLTFTDESGKAVTLGIRPEDVSVAPESGPALFTGESTVVHPPITAPARLELVEALGNEAFVYATVGKYSITARVAPRPFPAPGSPITLAFDLANAHFFDKTTGERIGKG
jgi:ABC-type sugar transport system ATPase subunit